MKKLSSNLKIAVLAVAMLSIAAFQQMKAADAGNGFAIETQTFLSYQTPSSYDKSDNAQIKGGNFFVGRSYLTVKKSITDYLSFRITTDSYQDMTVGDKSYGSFLMRLKYVYAQFKFGDFAFFTKPNIEFGLVHTPWLDFEEHTNFYRMQGTMFMERESQFASGDFGGTFMALFGGEMDKDYQTTVNKGYPGRYGSLALGVYNGGGYHAVETSNNKSVQARVTFRPLPDIIPGLQLSYLGIFGQGNTLLPDSTGKNMMSPDWQINAGMLSYEHQYFTITAQFLAGKGKGDGTDTLTITHEAAKVSGFSAFAEIKPTDHWRVIGRYDTYNPNTDATNAGWNETIAGIGYDFGGDHNNMLLLDYDSQSFADKSTNKAHTNNINYLKLTMQVQF